MKVLSHRIAFQRTYSHHVHREQWQRAPLMLPAALYGKLTVETQLFPILDPLLKSPLLMAPSQGHCIWRLLAVKLGTRKPGGQLMGHCLLAKRLLLRQTQHWWCCTSQAGSGAVQQTTPTALLKCLSPPPQPTDKVPPLSHKAQRRCLLACLRCAGSEWGACFRGGGG